MLAIINNLYEMTVLYIRQIKTKNLKGGQTVLEDETSAELDLD